MVLLAYMVHGQAEKLKGFRRRAQNSQSREEGLSTVLIEPRMPSRAVHNWASCLERWVGTEGRPPLGTWRGFGLPMRSFVPNTWRWSLDKHHLGARQEGSISDLLTQKLHSPTSWSDSPEVSCSERLCFWTSCIRITCKRDFKYQSQTFTMKLGLGLRSPC